MKKYKAWGTEIKCYKVMKETDKTINYLHDNNTLYKKEAKESMWYSWHDTFEDAKNYLIKKQENAIEDLKTSIKYFEERLEIINNLKNKNDE